MGDLTEQQKRVLAFGYAETMGAAAPPPSPTLPSREELRDLLLTFGEFGTSAGRERRNAEECASAIFALLTGLR